MSVSPTLLDQPSSNVGNAAFPKTSWSAISAARGTDDSKVIEGLRALATTYWRPLYVYLRRRGDSHEDACDSVQGFFESMFEGDFLSYVKRDCGKFRSYLLKSLERWRSRRHTFDRAQKRGGNVVHVPLDDLGDLVPEDSGGSASEGFDKQWAIDLMGLAVEGVRRDYEERQRGHWFELLRSGLPGGGQLAPYPELAKELDSTEGAIKKAVFDLRNAFARRLRSEIRATVATGEDADEELRYLLSILAS